MTTSRSLLHQGHKLFREGKVREAEKVMLDALAQAEKLAGKTPSADLLQALDSLARMNEFEKRDYPAAEKFYVRLLELNELDKGLAPKTVPLYLNRLASVASRRGQFDRATEFSKKALANLDGQKSPDLSILFEVLETRQDIYFVRAKYPESEVAARRMLECAGRFKQPAPKRVATIRALVKLADDLYFQDKFAEFEMRALLADKLMEAGEERNSKTRATLLAYLGDMYQQQERHLQAEAAYNKAVKIAQVAPWRDENFLAWLLGKQKLCQASLKPQRGSGVSAPGAGPPRPAVAPANDPAADRLNQIVAALKVKEIGQPMPDKTSAEREQLLRRELGFAIVHARDPYEIKTAEMLTDLADACSRQGKHQEASALLKEATKIYEVRLGPGSKPLLVVLTKRLAISRKTNRKMEEAALVARIKRNWKEADIGKSGEANATRTSDKSSAQVPSARQTEAQSIATKNVGGSFRTASTNDLKQALASARKSESSPTKADSLAQKVRLLARELPSGARKELVDKHSTAVNRFDSAYARYKTGGHPDALEAASEVASMRAEMGDHKQSVQILEEVISKYRQMPMQKRNLASALQKYAAVLTKAGRHEEAAKAKRQVNEILHSLGETSAGTAKSPGQTTSARPR